MSPSQVHRVDVDNETGNAVAIVPDRHLSLAIGKEGQNARLAAKLAGWKVDIKSDLEVDLSKMAPVEEDTSTAEDDSVEYQGDVLDNEGLIAAVVVLIMCCCCFICCGGAALVTKYLFKN